MAQIAWSQSAYFEWHFSKNDTSTGQALVIHGLNTKPEKMMDIIQELNLRGQDVLLLKLFGHNDDLNRMHEVTYDEWHDQVVSSLKFIKKINHIKGGAITLVAYSLGATLAMDVLSNDSSLKVNQAILFSPALKVRSTSHLVKFFRIFGKSFIVPSLSPETYKAQRGTSVAAYNALFDSITHFGQGTPHQIDFPTAVLIDEDDELVSFKGITQIASSLKNWNIIPLTNKKSKMDMLYHHLTITQESLGQEEWNNKVVPVFDSFFGKISN